MIILLLLTFFVTSALNAMSPDSIPWASECREFVESRAYVPARVVESHHCRMQPAHVVLTAIHGTNRPNDTISISTEPQNDEWTSGDSIMVYGLGLTTVVAASLVFCGSCN